MCPLHGAIFDVITGEVVLGPSPHGLRVFPGQGGGRRRAGGGGVARRKGKRPPLLAARRCDGRWAAGRLFRRSTALWGVVMSRWP